MLVQGVHLPVNREQYDAGRRRLIFQDLLELQLGLAMRRRTWQTRGAAARPSPCRRRSTPANPGACSPFQFTPGQNNAVREITADLDSPIAMHRLLQADVGAGKTAVAVYAMLVTVAAGFQTVLMAPTEVLASQHWRTIDRLLSQSRVNRVLLTGQLTAAERREALARIASGDVQLVIGTQAVIQHDVAFAKLGLVVIDEQHKFGVMQRAHFASGPLAPHTLVMTATPIPRSLCLTQFGDLDLSIMTDLPPGRQKVMTSRVTRVAWRGRKSGDFLRQKLAAGRQAYVICPRVGTGDDGPCEPDNLGAEQMFRRLSTSGVAAAFVSARSHGQLDSMRAKIAAMEEFRDGRARRCWSPRPSWKSASTCRTPR